MAHNLDSSHGGARGISSAVASAIVGLALGVVAVVGITQFSSHSVESNAVTADDALLGSPEYGTRN